MVDAIAPLLGGLLKEDVCSHLLSIKSLLDDIAFIKVFFFFLRDSQLRVIHDTKKPKANSSIFVFTIYIYIDFYLVLLKIDFMFLDDFPFLHLNKNPVPS